MLRLFLNILLLVGLSSIIFAMATKAEEIHFYNEISNRLTNPTIYENETFFHPLS